MQLVIPIKDPGETKNKTSRIISASPKCLYNSNYNYSHHAEKHCIIQKSEAQRNWSYPVKFKVSQALTQLLIDQFSSLLFKRHLSQFWTLAHILSTTAVAANLQEMPYAGLQRQRRHGGGLCSEKEKKKKLAFLQLPLSNLKMGENNRRR